MNWLVLLSSLALGCSPASVAGEEAGTCPDDLPEHCPASVPSYREDIAPILKASCTVCHSPSGAAGFSETTYEEVFDQRSGILDQVYGCQMPPNTYPMTTEQRETLLAWLVCGAPDN